MTSDALRALLARGEVAGDGFQTIAVAIAFAGIEIIATLLRAWSKTLQMRGWIWSDVFVLLSLLFNIGVCVTAILVAYLNPYAKAGSISAEEYASFIILLDYGIPPLYLAAVTFPKLAILDLYLHIFVNKLSRYITYGLGAVIALSAAVNFATLMTQCQPINQPWNPTPGGSCDNIPAHFTWASVPNIVTDAIMLVLPIPVLLKLQMAWQVKLGVVITILIGSLGLITSVLRFAQFYEYLWAIAGHEPIWASESDMIWTVVEPGVYHLAACLVMYRPLLKWVAMESPLSPLFARFRQRPNNKGKGVAVAVGSAVVSPRPMVDAAFRSVSYGSDGAFHTRRHTSTLEPHEIACLDAYRLDDLEREILGLTHPSSNAPHLKDGDPSDEYGWV